MNRIPIAIFTYAHPIHTKTILDALLTNADLEAFDIFIFLDGAKEGKEEQRAGKIDY